MCKSEPCMTGCTVSHYHHWCQLPNAGDRYTYLFPCWLNQPGQWDPVKFCTMSHLASIKSLTCLLQSSTRSLPWIQVKLWLFIISSNCCWIWNGCLWCLYNLSIKEYYLSDWSIKRNIFLLCINCVHLSVSLITLSGRRSLSHLLLHCNNCQFWSISLYEWGWNWINTL